MGILIMIGFTVSEIFALFVVSGIFFDWKIDKKELFLIFPTFCCCSSFLWLLLPYFGSRYLKMGACLLIISIVMTLFYRGNLGKKLFVSLIYYIYLYVLDYTVMGMGIIISGLGVERIRERLPVWIVGSILAKSVLFLVGLIIMRMVSLTKMRKKHSALFWMQILLIPFCMILNLGLVLFYMNQTEKFHFLLWLDAVALIAGNLLFLFLEQKLEEEWETRMENQELLRLSEEAKQKTAIMETSYQEQRKHHKSTLKKSNEDIKVLKGLSFSVEEGEFVGIMGKSGCGKTTLLKVLGMIDKQTGGIIRFMGKDTSELFGDTLADIRRTQIGFIFQDFYLMDSLSVEENIMLPIILGKEEVKVMTEAALRYAKQFQIEHLLKKSPYELSGGEKQRVAICRALINNPDLVLADEPTGNLDSKSGAIVIDALEKINQEFGKTIVMVTHDPQMASHCKKIILLKDGVILDTLRRKDSREHFYQEIIERMVDL